GKPLKSLSQGEIDFGLIPLLETEKKPEAESKADEVDEAAVIAAVKAALGERVTDVGASERLTDSAAGPVAGGGGPDRAPARWRARANRGAGTKPIRELNRRHVLVKALAQARDAARDEDVTDYAALLLEEAQILDGEVPEDPAGFTARVNRLVARAAGM